MEARGKSKVLKSCYKQLEESYTNKSKVILFLLYNTGKTDAAMDIMVTTPPKVWTTAVPH